MKKLNLLLSMFLLTGAVLLTSCGKDEDKTDPGPALTLKSGDNYTSADKTIQVNTNLLVGITAAKSPVSGQKLTRFRLSNISNNVSATVFDTLFSLDSYNWERSIPFNSVGSARLLFELWDNAGVKVEKGFDVTIEDPGMQVNKYTSISLGSLNDAFYSSTENNVYLLSQLTNTPANQSKIDLIFFKYDTANNTIASPADELSNMVTELQLILWTNKNQTVFNTTTITAAQFDAIDQTFQFPAFNLNAQSSRVTNLQVGQVILFKTQANKLGLIKVVNFNTTDRMEMDIVIQK